MCPPRLGDKNATVLNTNYRQWVQTPEHTKEPSQSNQVKWGACKWFKSTTTKYSNFFLLQETLLLLSAHTEIHPSLQRLCPPWSFSLRQVWGWAQCQDGTCPDCVPLRNWLMPAPYSTPLSTRHVPSIHTCSLTNLEKRIIAWLLLEVPYHKKLENC